MDKSNTGSGKEREDCSPDPRVLLLREEYLDYCRNGGLKLPSYEQYGDARQIILDLRDAGVSEVHSIYAQTAIIAMDRLQIPAKKRPPFEIHPRLAIGYGARVAGYVELLEKTLLDSIFAFTDAVYIDELRLDSFNGQAARSRRVCNGYFCFLNYGLFRLLHHISLASSLISDPELEEHVDKPYEVYPALKGIAAGIAKRTMEAYLSGRQHQLIASRQFQLSSDGFLLANELTFAMKTFVVAHELAHIRLGHLDRLAAFAGSEERWQMEFEADELALQCLIQIAETKRARPEILGGGIAFLFCDLIKRKVSCEVQGCSLELLEIDSTHPPPLQRIKRLDDMLNEHFSKESRFDRQCLAPLWNLQQMIMEMDRLAGVNS